MTFVYICSVLLFKRGRRLFLIFTSVDTGLCVLEGQHYSPALELKTQGLADQLTEFHLFKGVAGLRNLSAKFTVGRSLLAQAQAF